MINFGQPFTQNLYPDIYQIPNIYQNQYQDIYQNPFQYPYIEPLPKEHQDRILINNPYIKDDLHYNLFGHNQIADYLYFIFLDKWLFKYHSKVFKYLKNNNGDIHVVKSASEKDTNNNEGYDVEKKKIDFIEKNLFTRDECLIVLHKLMDKYSLNWANIAKPQYIRLVRKSFWKYLKNKLDDKLH